MPTGIPKNGINKGWIKKGNRLGLKTEFKKGVIPWNKNKIGWLKHTEEWKKEMSKKMKGHPFWGGEETQFKKGHPVTEKIRENMKKVGISGKGRKMSESTKQKIKES